MVLLWVPKLAVVIVIKMGTQVSPGSYSPWRRQNAGGSADNNPGLLAVAGLQISDSVGIQDWRIT